MTFYSNVSLKGFIAALILFLLIVVSSTLSAKSINIDPSQAYKQALQIEKEVDLLLRHAAISKVHSTTDIKANLKPRHVYEKAYIILTKIQVLRQKHGFSRFTIVSLEPKMSVDSELVYEQTQRILTELRIIKTRLGITEEISAASYIVDKKPIDVFNKLHQISMKLELLNEEEINPNNVFSLVMKINEEANTIVQYLYLDDATYPPEKALSTTPGESLNTVFELMKNIQRLQRQLNIERTDFSSFHSKNANEDFAPSDVFNMVSMCFAEMQTIKAHLGITSIAAPAKQFEGKMPADVQQLLRWVNRKLRLIERII